MNPTLAMLLTISVTVIAAILVLVPIFLIPVLPQARRAAHAAEKSIDKDPQEGGPMGGIPKEGRGFSNDVKALLGALPFSAASFKYDGGTLNRTISLHY